MVLREKKLKALLRCTMLDDRAFAKILDAVFREPEDIENGWCQVLEIMIGLRRRKRFPTSLAFDAEIADMSGDLICASCTRPAEQHGLFCDYFCKQMAKAVRSARKSIANGRFNDDFYQIGLEQKIKSLVDGGYPERERRLPKARRQAIFQRDNYKCQLCPSEATEIDHICGNSSDPCNLRAICGTCNRMLAMRGDEDATDEERLDFFDEAHGVIGELALRIASPLPLLSCDNHELWNAAQTSVRRQRRLLYEEPLQLKPTIVRKSRPAKHVKSVVAAVWDNRDKKSTCLDSEDDSEWEDVNGYLGRVTREDD